MRTEKPIDRKSRIMPALLICAALSWYLCGIISTSFHTSRSFRLVKMVSSFRQYGFPWLLFLVAFAVLFIGYIAMLNQDILTQSQRDRFGRFIYSNRNSSHFEDESEFNDHVHLLTVEEAQGTIFGEWIADYSPLDVFKEKSWAYVVAFKPGKNRLNQHILVCGPSGSGKTTSFSNSYIFQTVKRGESIVVVDPKGDMYKTHAGMLRNAGYVLRVFDLNEFEKSDGWDCLKSLGNGNNVNSTSTIFSNTVISNASTAAPNEYTNPCMSLLKALVLRVWLDPKRPPAKKNITEVYKLLMDADSIEDLANQFKRTAMPRECWPCIDPFNSAMKGSENFRSNVVSNLSIQLQAFQDEQVCKILSTDDIDLTLPGKRKCAYFVRFKDNDDTYKFLFSLFITMLFQSLINLADSKRSGCLDVPVNFLLEEFPSLGVIPGFDTIMSTVRSRRINIAMVFQVFPQLEKLYAEAWETIYSNCSALVVLSVSDNRTAEYISERIGKAATEAKSEQHNGNRATGLLFNDNPYSTSEELRELMSPSDLQTMDIDEMLLILQSHYPIHLQKFLYERHPFAQLLCDDPLGDMPSMFTEEGQKARAERRRKEKEIIAAYERAHPDKISVDVPELEYDTRSDAQVYIDNLKSDITAKVATVKKEPDNDSVIFEFDEEEPASEFIPDISIEPMPATRKPEPAPEPEPEPEAEEPLTQEPDTPETAEVAATAKVSASAMDDWDSITF